MNSEVTRRKPRSRRRLATAPRVVKPSSRDATQLVMKRPRGAPLALEAVGPRVEVVGYAFISAVVLLASALGDPQLTASQRALSLPFSSTAATAWK